jgi:thioester reductase-like protein
MKPPPTRFVAELAPEQAARVEILVGRTTDVDLGLPGRQVQAVLSETTLVFHAATEQHGTRADLLRANRAALANLLSLGRDFEVLERFCLFSSAFVSGDRRGLILEEDLDAGSASTRCSKRRCSRPSSWRVP